MICYFIYLWPFVWYIHKNDGNLSFSCINSVIETNQSEYIRDNMKISQFNIIDHPHFSIWTYLHFPFPLFAPLFCQFPFPQVIFYLLFLLFNLLFRELAFSTDCFLSEKWCLSYLCGIWYLGVGVIGVINGL